MSTSVRVQFSPEAHRVLTRVCVASGTTRAEFIRHLFFAWRDANNLLLTNPEPKVG